MSYLPFLRPLLRALGAAWHFDVDARAEERYYADAVDLYDLERRMADRARELYPAFVGR
jgi:hypothetical protein